MTQQKKHKNTADLSPKTVIIVPCYNEAKRMMPARFLKFLRMTENINFLFVNDGSTDQTADILNRLKNYAPEKVDVMHLDKNAGKQEAVRTGLNFAITQGATITGYWDADLAAPLTELPPMQNRLLRNPKLQCVYGTRIKLLGHQIHRKLVRRGISLCCRVLAQSVLDLPVTDTQCGAKIFRVTPEFSRAIALPFRANWLFDVELFARLKTEFGQKNPGLYEMPLSEWSEIAGSNVSSLEMIGAGFTMLKLIAEMRMGIKFGKPKPIETRFTMAAIPRKTSKNRIA